MNQRYALITLLVVSIAVSPFLFALPSVFAIKPDIDPVVIRIDRDYLSPKGAPWNERPWTEYFDITIVEIQFPATWKQIGDIYEVTVKEDDTVNNILYETALYQYLDNNDNDGLVEILLLLHNKYLKWTDELVIVQYAVFGDVNGDGVANQEDKKLVSNANHQPDLYSWKYDFNQDGYITDEDVRAVTSYLGTSAMWMELEMPADRVVDYNGYNYLITDLWHFSGWGIRR
ncbi:MAG: hypothetical protein JSV76_03755 [Candidatus Bathyarchaeota archaeon]|nr:MAG: hypothetical protein JSV76_03755 [Candidatus Bathyarchaeota archaeon]